MPCATPAADHLCLNRVHRLIFVTSGRALERTARGLRLRALGGDADGPDEAQQLSPHGGDDLLLRFAFCQQLRVSGMQAMLGFPSDRLDLLALIPLPSQQRGGQVRGDAGRPRPPR